MQRRTSSRGPAPSRPGPGRLLLLSVIALALAGCGERGCGPVVARYHESSADDLQAPTRTYTLHASKRRVEAPRQKPPPPPPAPRGKVHPLVQRQIAAMNPNDFGEFLVTFRDTVGPAVRTLGLSKHELRDTLERRRAPLYDALSMDLDADHNAIRITTFWLIHAVLVRMPAGQVVPLAARPDVIRIEPVWGGPPPQFGVCGSEDKNLAYARGQLGSDSYVSTGYGEGILALLDTGTFTDHDLIRTTGRVETLLDCDEEDCHPVDPGTQRDLVSEGHGTASAAILTGESAAMPEDAGLTRAKVHSYQVYGFSPAGAVEVNLPAAARAFETATISEAEFCVAEIAVEEGGPGALTEAAGAMFAQNVGVFVANGNDGDEVASPAGATRAMGIGAYCAATDAFVHEFVDGRTADGRWKPDVTSITGIWTAGNGDPAAMQSYGGTSGATPFVAGAALLLRNRMQQGGVKALPGNVYATLLLSADRDHAEPEEGAGRVRLPNDGAIWWGSFDVSQSEAWSLPIEIETDGRAIIEALVWWPRAGATAFELPGTAGFSDIDLVLYDASGNEVDRSDDVSAVYERTAGEIPAGSSGKWWSAKVYGYTVPDGSKQTVYWAVRVREAE